MSDMSLKSGLSTVFPARDRANARAVGQWLLAVAGIVFLMVVVGGITRLTESGLSMVDWRPVTGWLPPLSEAAWLAEFEKYKRFPEYQVLNRGMSLAEFKTIFYWEWGHRVLGRVIGLAFFVPMVVFWVRGMIPAGYKPKLLALLVLGGSQGLLGWYMVQSGLVDEPEVSHLRLTAHLSLALFIFSCLFWVALDLLRPADGRTDGRFRSLAIGFMGLIALQLVMGGLVAGLKAGYAFNTWPLMNGALVPAHLFDISPWWRNLVDNAMTVQFNHRMGAYGLLAVGGVLVTKVLRHADDPSTRRAACLLAAALFGQVLIGILTLLYMVPVPLGALHQGGGVVVLAASLNLMHKLRARPA